MSYGTVLTACIQYITSMKYKARRKSIIKNIKNIYRTLYHKLTMRSREKVTGEKTDRNKMRESMQYIIYSV